MSEQRDKMRDLVEQQLAIVKRQLEIAEATIELLEKLHRGLSYPSDESDPE